MEGDKQFETKASLMFPKKGIGIVIVNYRLSPGITHPAHITDAAALHELMPCVAAGYDRGLWMPGIRQLRNPRLLRKHPRVIAFSSCRPVDGGTGACDVLLSARKGKPA